MGRGALIVLALALSTPAWAHGPVPAFGPALLASDDPSALAEQGLRPLGHGEAPEVLARLAALAGIAASPRAVPPVEAPWLADAPTELQPALAQAWGGIVAAERELALALADLDASERAAWFADLGPGWGARQAIAAGLGSPQDHAKLAAFLRITDQVHLDHLAAAQLALLDAAQRALPLLPSAAGTEQSPCGTGTLVFASPGCTVVVGGAGPNTYPLDVVLLVDLGGGDTYANNAGGGTLRAAMLLDRGADDDTYASTADPGDAVQGSGSIGAGLLVDEGGDDTYQAFATSSIAAGRITAQGSALIGAGVLWDRGAGADEYESRNIAQGAALSGIGLLLDEGGADDYTIPYTFDSEAGQGTGCFAGAGALVDQGAGSDDYVAFIDDMQGFGCAAGVGVLWDGGGDDLYWLRSGFGDLGGSTVVQSGFGQGYGELGASLGAIVDEGGDDDYIVESNGGSAEGFQAQAVGNVGAVGLILDAGGADEYESVRRTQGWGGFGGLGLLLDRGGGDTYTADLECQGSGFAGSGLLLDLGAALDTYNCNEAPTFGARADGSAWVTVLGSGGLDA